MKIDLNQSSDGGGPGKGWVKLVAGYIFIITEGNQSVLNNCDVFYLEKDILLQSGINTTNLGIKTKYKFAQFVQVFKDSKDIIQFGDTIIGI